MFREKLCWRMRSNQSNATNFCAFTVLLYLGRAVTDRQFKNNITASREESDKQGYPETDIEEGREEARGRS